MVTYQKQLKHRDRLRKNGFSNHFLVIGLPNVKQKKKPIENRYSTYLYALWRRITFEKAK